MTLECHELTINAATGAAALAYLGAVPWHGLGQQITETATIEEVRKAAGMDFTLETAPVQFDTTLNGVPLTIPYPDRMAVYRSDNRAPMGLVSKRFQVVQPAEALDFFRDMVAAGGYVMETAGTMRGGSRLFAVAKQAESFDLAGGDHVEARIMFATACDGTMSTTARQMAIRVVCRNTMRAAIKGWPSAAAVRHTTKFDAAEMKLKLEKVSKSFAAYATAARAMSERQMTQAAADAFLKALLPTPQAGLVQETRTFKRILALFNGEGMGATLPSANGTAWGLLNAVTEYADHHVPARTDLNRQDSGQFGAGDALKTRALELMTA